MFCRLEGLGDWERDVFIVDFFFDEAPCRPLADEFFESLGLDLANLSLRLCISRVRPATAVIVDFLMSSWSSSGGTLGAQSIRVVVSAVAFSRITSVLNASS